LGKPLVHAGIGEFYGQLMTITPGKGPCLRCIFPDGVSEENQKKPFGVIGPTPGVLGAMQVMETAKYLLGMQVCNNCLVTYDGIEMNIKKVAISASKECICSKTVMAE